MFDLYHKYHFIGEHSVLYGLVLYPPFKNVLLQFCKCTFSYICIMFNCSTLKNSQNKFTPAVSWVVPFKKVLIICTFEVLI